LHTLCSFACSNGQVVLTGSYNTVDLTTNGISSIYVSGVKQAREPSSRARLLVASRSNVFSQLVVPNKPRPSVAGILACLLRALALKQQVTCVLVLPLLQGITTNLNGITTLYLDPASASVPITGRQARRRQAT
jgi:hypothetical protein